jgi:hypothetical protein
VSCAGILIAKTGIIGSLSTLIARGHTVRTRFFLGGDVSVMPYVGDGLPAVLGLTNTPCWSSTNDAPVKDLLIAS